MADMLTTERMTFRFRLLALLAISLAAFLADSPANAGRIVIISVVYLAYTLVLHTQLPRFSRPELVYVMIVIDACTLGLMLHWLGGAASLVVVLVPLLVPFYAVYGSYYTSFFAATVMLIVLAASQVAQGRAALTAAFVTEMPLYYLLAALSGYLAHGRIRRQEEQEALQRLVRLENEARSLSGAVRTIQESADLAPTLQEMVEAVPVLTGLPDCLVALLDRKSGALVTRATTADLTRMGVERVDYLVEWPREGNLFDAVMTHNAPVAISSQGGNLHLMPQWAQQLKTGPLLCVPLGSRGVDVGVMFFFGVPAEYEFTGRDMQLAQAFANLIALVAVNAQLYEDVQVTVASVMSDLRPVVLPKPTAKPRHFTTIEVGDLLVDLPNRQAKIAGKVVNLTPTEFDLLAVLAENNGHAVDQDNLLRRVWGEDYHGRSTVVDVGVHRLRRKIEEGQGAPRRIITVRGSGYMLVPGTAMPRQGVD